MTNNSPSSPDASRRNVSKAPASTQNDNACDRIHLTVAAALLLADSKSDPSYLENVALRVLAAEVRRLGRELNRLTRGDV